MRLEVANLCIWLAFNENIFLIKIRFLFFSQRLAVANISLGALLCLIY